MNTLINEIKALSGENVLEAANFVSLEITGEGGDDAENAVLSPIRRNPDKYFKDVVEIGRCVLINAALITEFEGVVRNAVKGVGRKNVILGGAEIVAISLIGYAALRTILTKGKKSEKKTLRKPDGTVIEIDIVYDADNSFLSEIFRSLFK